VEFESFRFADGLTAELGGSLAFGRQPCKPRTAALVRHDKGLAWINPKRIDGTGATASID